MTTAADRIAQHKRGDYGVGSSEFRTTLDGLFDDALRFQERVTGSAWAEAYGRIPQGTGAQPGPVTLYGYQRGLLDAMCDPRVPLVTVLKAARVGFTRCATLALGYHMHQDPTLCAIAQPTEDDAEDYAGGEVLPMLRETPVLARMLRPIKFGETRDKTVMTRLTNGASVRSVGAAADDAFRRYSARFLFADEIDGEGWTPNAKTQGDKLKLFWTRGEEYYNRKMVRGSTPLLEETSRIWKLWLQSDQRRYFVPCRQCSDAAGHLDGWQYLEWGEKGTAHGIKYELHEDGSLKAVWYQGLCGCIIPESDKAWMDARGEWRPTAKPRTPGHVGFHLWTGMSLYANAAWPIIAQEWIEAQDDTASLVQPFRNLRLGLPYKLTYGQEIKPAAFLERLEEYGAEVPDWVQYLTLGGDVQSGANARIEGGIYGWGAGLESALIGHFVLPGDPGDSEVWQALDILLRREFRKADGTGLRVRAAAIDSGGHHTAETYAFCNERRKRRIWAIKGKSEARGSRTRVWPRMPSTKLGSSWFMIGGNAARDWAYNSLVVTDPGSRHVHFPVEAASGSRPIDAEFFEQMTREKLVVRRQGFTEWIKPKAAHEVGVCWVYAYVAVCGLQALSGRYVAMGRMPSSQQPTDVRDNEVATVEAAQPDRAAAPPRPSYDAPEPGHVPQRNPRSKPRPGGWLAPRSGWLR